MVSKIEYSKMKVYLELPDSELYGNLFKKILSFKFNLMSLFFSSLFIF